MTEVTAGGIRSGEPDALAGLCKRRGGAVLVYCEYVAAPGQAGHAAADAFALFRANVYASNELTFDAESLLLSATRQAAAARAPRPAADEQVDCPDPALLVGWIEDTLSAAQREDFEEHAATCIACVDAVTRFEAAERAYEHPPKAPLPLSVTRKIVDALVAAAPVTAMNGDAAAVHEAAEQGAAVNAAPPREARVPVAAASIAAPLPAETQAPADQANGTGAPSPRGAGRAASAAVAGGTMIDRVQELSERRRRAPRARPFENRGLGLDHGTGRRWAYGVALGGVVALIVSLALFISDDSPTPSGESPSSLAGGPQAPEPVAEPPTALEDEPGAEAAKKPAKSTPEARERQARRAAPERRAQRAARSRRAAAARRRAAAAAARRRAAASPSRARTPARSPSSPAPAARRPARPTPPPAPAPARPQQDRTPAQPAPSDELPGGDFTVSGET